MKTNNNKTIKIATILEYIFFLVIPLSIFFYVAINNKKKLDQSSLKSKQQEEHVKTEKSLVNDGLTYLRQKKYNKSIAINLEVIKINKNNKTAYNNIGIAYANLKQWDKAIEYCSKALSIDPNFQLAKNNIYWMKTEKKKLISNQ